MIQVIVKALPLSMNATDAAEYLGSRQLFEDMRAAKWIVPIVEGHRRTLFDRSELEACYARIRVGEYPKVPGEPEWPLARPQKKKKRPRPT